jgi:integrase
MMNPAPLKTIPELVEDYLSERLLRPASCSLYTEVAQRWVNETGNDIVASVTVEEVREWRSTVLARASAQTWNLYRRHLRALWNHAVRHGASSGNPFAETPPARAPNVRKKVVANIDLENSIAALQSFNTNEHNTHPAWFWAIVIRTFYYTGIRRRQLVELKWEDINFDDAAIHLRASSSKTHREWFIPIARPLLPELENLLMVTTDRIQREPPGHSQVFNVTLFHDRFKGEQMTVHQLSGAFERLSKALGVRITPHRLRHTMATELAARKDIRTLQQLLGHTDIQTTMQYVHPDMDRMRNLLEGMSI